MADDEKKINPPTETGKSNRKRFIRNGAEKEKGRARNPRNVFFYVLQRPRPMVRGGRPIMFRSHCYDV
ncbi:hypothetical protein GWI33_015556 [Rhynchophorus ferrugineus]|uniref:Uncharacterized protein n=1 Tax=Rhynchophorus ferrugineus TaxID=354439 RepID=A0A834I548_RHYFE|nr:hypothetical protein GWI33_015556 [Rhynchophorus ferrugineus]